MKRIAMAVLVILIPSGWPCRASRRFKKTLSKNRSEKVGAESLQSGARREESFCDGWYQLCVLGLPESHAIDDGHHRPCLRPADRSLPQKRRLEDFAGLLQGSRHRRGDSPSENRDRNCWLWSRPGTRTTRAWGHAPIFASLPRQDHAIHNLYEPPPIERQPHVVFISPFCPTS